MKYNFNSHKIEERHQHPIEGVWGSGKPVGNRYCVGCSNHSIQKEVIYVFGNLGRARQGNSILMALLIGFGTLLAPVGAVPQQAFAETETAAAAAAAVSPEAAMATATASGVETFESLTDLYVTSARANSVKLELIGRPETIQQGYRAAKLSYDFSGTTGTSAAYLNFRDPGGAAGRTLQGAPKKLGVWVYGDGNSHWLRAQLQDAAGTKSTVDFTASGGLSWTGWKFVTVSIPANLPSPLKLNQIYVVETKDTNKNSGALHFDNLQTFYTDSDVYGLELAGLTPLQTGESKQAKVFAVYQGSTEPVEAAGGLAFRSSNEQVAAVGPDGTVHARQAGTAVIMADYGSGPQAQAAYTLTVSAEAPAPERLELQSPVRLETGGSSRLQVFAAYPGQAEPSRILSGVSFQSGSPEVAAVDAGGTVKALKAGTAVITAAFGGRSVQHSLTAADPVPVLQKIELRGLKTMTVGETKQLKVFGTYTGMNEPVELTSGVTFKSSVPEVASVGANGLVTALKRGTSRITAAYGGKTTDFYLVVNNPAADPKQEMRAAWIATVDNIDWPQKGVTAAEEQKRDFKALLDQLQEAGMNAVIVQVKPTADAFYPSGYGPWSEWLTGVQGRDPGYNPLAFMLEEVHKRNMEFHAWFNPYRISLHDSIDRLVPDHPARQHPDWVVSYGGKLYFNPGIPEAKDFIVGSVMEVVRNYDIDAIHFDDYFYPYPVSGVDFPDDQAYRTYGSAFPNKADWRRNNVDMFVKEMNETIKREKHHVKFGISPFGIWKNKSEDPAGSDTNGLSSYSAIFADSKKWVDREWIDYITPQIYWYMGYSPAAYDKLIEWWSGAVQGKNVHLYSGNAVYRVGSADPAWQNPDEMPDQIAYNRNFEPVRGSMFFSAKWFKENPLGVTDRLKTELYRYPALVPAMPWLDRTAPAAPARLTAVRGQDGVALAWSDESPSDAAYYAVYRTPGAGPADTGSAAHIAGFVRRQPGVSVQTYTDPIPADGMSYTYAVTAVDRLHNESAPSAGITVTNRPDGTPPVTRVSLEGTLRNGWYVSEVAVKLTASDEQSGVKRTEYSLDGGASWQAYASSPIMLEADGAAELQYRSEDGAGNLEQAGTVRIPIDRTAPSLQIFGAQLYTVDSQVKITCTAADTVSGLVYHPCGAPLVDLPAYRLDLGEHKVEVQAEDAAGNVGKASAVYTVQATPDSLGNLTRTFLAGPGAEGVAKSLQVKLKHGQTAAFIHEVRAQTGKRLTEEQGAILIRLAEAMEGNPHP